MTRFWWGILAAALVGVSAAFVWKTATRNPGDAALPVLEHVPMFKLQDQSGRVMTRNDLSGKTWIADFIYTTCPDQCPMMSRHMQTLQGLLPKESTVQLVSISVDPLHDTPAVLARYAQRYQADTTRWHFLTGTPEAVQKLLAGLKLTPPANPPGIKEISHSSRLVLIDPAADVRGYYDATDDQDVQRLVKDLSAFSR